MRLNIRCDLIAERAVSSSRSTSSFSVPPNSVAVELRAVVFVVRLLAEVVQPDGSSKLIFESEPVGDVIAPRRFDD